MAHEYLHRVQYYETDGMRIVHHSNYIRWFEEARMFGMEEDGFGYDKLEERGIIIPCLSVECDYKAAVRFGSIVKIFCEVESFNGLRFTIRYIVTSEDGSILHATGRSTHCFLGMDMRPVNVKKHAPDIYRYVLGDVENKQH